MHVPPPIFEYGAAGAPIVPRVRFALPVFCKVNVCGEDPPTATEPKSIGFGEALITGPMVVPVIGIFTNAVNGSFDGILILSGNVPLEVGVNLTVIVHVPFCARIRPMQVSDVLLYGAEGDETGPIIRWPAPLFWTVRVRFAELPTDTTPKSRLGGVTLIAGGTVIT